jgi:hypothetical protein
MPQGVALGLFEGQLATLPIALEAAAGILGGGLVGGRSAAEVFAHDPAIDPFGTSVVAAFPVARLPRHVRRPRLWLRVVKGM